MTAFIAALPANDIEGTISAALPEKNSSPAVVQPTGFPQKKFPDRHYLLKTPEIKNGTAASAAPLARIYYNFFDRRLRMFPWKHIGCVSASLLPVILTGCCDTLAARPYYGIPYCCDRTAGTGIEHYCAESRPVAMERQPAPVYVEPAAGDVIFNKAMHK